MARRPQRQVEEFEKSNVVFTPCGFCCTMMEIPKAIIENGGLWRCKKCGYGVKYKPTKIVVAHDEVKHNYGARILRSSFV